LPSGYDRLTTITMFRWPDGAGIWRRPFEAVRAIRSLRWSNHRQQAAEARGERTKELTRPSVWPLAPCHSTKHGHRRLRYAPHRHRCPRRPARRSGHDRNGPPCSEPANRPGHPTARQQSICSTSHVPTHSLTAQDALWLSAAAGRWRLVAGGLRCAPEPRTIRSKA
jgi:hypothetical protein